MFEGVEFVTTSRLGILVHARKPLFGFVKKNDWTDAWYVHVKAAPQHNQANAEIEKECTRLFGVHVTIVKGHSSSRKVLDIPLPRVNVERMLEQHRIL